MELEAGKEWTSACSSPLKKEPDHEILADDWVRKQILVFTLFLVLALGALAVVSLRFVFSENALTAKECSALRSEADTIVQYVSLRNEKGSIAIDDLCRFPETERFVARLPGMVDIRVDSTEQTSMVVITSVRRGLTRDRIGEIYIVPRSVNAKSGCASLGIGKSGSFSEECVGVYRFDRVLAR